MHASHLFRFTGQVEVYTNPWDPYWKYQGPQILRVNTMVAAASETQAMRDVARDISSLYSDDWHWMWWKALRS